MRSATSWARSSSRSPGNAASSATSQSAAIDTASRTLRSDAIGAPSPSSAIQLRAPSDDSKAQT